MFGQKEPDLIIRSTPWTQKAGANDTWWKPVVRAGRHRAALGARDRSAARHGEGPQDHASRERRPHAGRARRADAGGPGPVHGMGGRQGGRDDAAEQRQADAARLADRLGHPLLSTASEDITDVVELGIYFYPKGQEPKYRQQLLRMGKTGAGAIDIPPNTGRSRPRGYLPAAPGGAHRELPAAHAPARQGDVAGSDPADGQTVILSHVANFNFNWHNTYVYADNAAPLLPKGTIIKITAWHDNTAANKSNPDPNVWVGYGDRTVDEMAHAWVNVTYLNDEDYPREVEARRAQLTTSGTR